MLAAAADIFLVAFLLRLHYTLPNLWYVELCTIYFRSTMPYSVCFSVNGGFEELSEKETNNIKPPSYLPLTFKFYLFLPVFELRPALQRLAN